MKFGTLNVKSFCRLGSLKTELGELIAAGNACYLSVKSLSFSCLLSENVEIKILSCDGMIVEEVWSDNWIYLTLKDHNYM
jgi:hypothetical protein